MEEMPKNYDPSTNEPAILQKWLDGGYYKRREGVGDCTVTIPPPNVTGKLHMGHATDDSSTACPFSFACLMKSHTIRKYPSNPIW